MGRLHGPVVGGVVQIDQRVKFRKEVQSGLFYPWSNVWYVDGDDGNSGYDGKSPSNSKALPSQAIAAASDNDFIYLKAADYTETVALVLSLNDVNIIGASPTPNQPHLDIWQSGTYDPMITVSGRGNALYNLVFRHGTAATDLNCMLISGRYNYFENVYWYTPQVAAQDISTYVGVDITGHGNYFKGCHFGNDGLVRDGVNYNVKLSTRGNVFEDCVFTMEANGVSPAFIQIDSADDTRYNYFKNCLFHAHWANHVDQITYAVKVTGAGSTANVVFDSRCVFAGVDYISDTADDDHIWIATPGDTAATAASLIAKRSLGT